MHFFYSITELVHDNLSGDGSFCKSWWIHHRPSQIRTIRSVLMSLIKASPRVLSGETLHTFLVEAEGIVNSRPLTLENLSDPESKPLSPQQILTMKSHIISSPPGEFQKADVYCRKRWRISQHMANDFWNRWRKEYLINLSVSQVFEKFFRKSHSSSRYRFA